MIFKKIAIISLFFTQLAYASNIEICPSVDEIKRGQFNYWLPLYKEGEELASDKDVVQFMQSITDFDTAKWNVSYLESGHCFYKGSDPIMDKIIFAKDAWRPVNSPYWIWVTPDRIAECTSKSVNDCGMIQ